MLLKQDTDINNLNKHTEICINNDSMCCICLENFLDNQKKNIIYIKSCKHIYHQECLYNWYKNKLYCPYCRKKLFS